MCKTTCWMLVDYPSIVVTPKYSWSDDMEWGNAHGHSQHNLHCFSATVIILVHALALWGNAVCYQHSVAQATTSNTFPIGPGMDQLGYD